MHFLAFNSLRVQTSRQCCIDNIDLDLRLGTNGFAKTFCKGGIFNTDIGNTSSPIVNGQHSNVLDGDVEFQVFEELGNARLVAVRGQHVDANSREVGLQAGLENNSAISELNYGAANLTDPGV